MNVATLVAKPSEITRFHGQLSHEIAVILERKCDINTSYQERSTWKDCRTEQEIEFFLWDTDDHQYLGQRAGGRTTCPILPGPKQGDTWKNGEFVWVAWRDVWKKKAKSKRNDEFDLQDVSLTFFWGAPRISGGIADQVIRAEWVQQNDEGKPFIGEYAAHPHWHFDFPQPDLETTTAKVHLGMAGWEMPLSNHHGLKSDSHCSVYWQRFAHGFGDIIVWATRTIAYVLDQIVRHYPASFGL